MTDRTRPSRDSRFDDDRTDDRYIDDDRYVDADADRSDRRGPARRRPSVTIEGLLDGFSSDIDQLYTDLQRTAQLDERRLQELAQNQRKLMVIMTMLSRRNGAQAQALLDSVNAFRVANGDLPFTLPGALASSSAPGTPGLPAAMPMPGAPVAAPLPAGSLPPAPPVGANPAPAQAQTAEQPRIAVPPAPQAGTYTAASSDKKSLKWIVFALVAAVFIGLSFLFDIHTGNAGLDYVVVVVKVLVAAGLAWVVTAKFVLPSIVGTRSVRS
ncbi:MAG TPA: hypothetical protein VLF59_02175 [Candidatus Saccharimonadales bacterium]|nr:hypothetical protein [Candidatus Saccharimonadales bacterium]